ncbi:hypothetical protein [Sphingobacterium detergens]|uniref:Uncharacterized protein n=1 Tax=Sphingobacterium detergens TaxID=1145106 RepID=A0A420ARN6_SPHD1|nr:hypothetical protein [Sphingobacterium detergens]RKE47132.1 hypothetical protein DFQ12_4293 [Sphingobacterium detergens]
MKKINKAPSKLKLTTLKILVLTPNQMHNILAGDDTSIFTKPGSFECIPPFNAPPYFNTTKE